MKKILLVVLVVAIAWLAYKIIKDPSGSGLWLLNKAVSLSTQYTKTQDIAYGEAAWQTLDIYQQTQRDERPQALIVFMFGGGWTGGDKSQFEFIAEAFLQRGYIVAIPNYGLYPESKYPQFIEDTAKAIAWLYKNIGAYGGDNNQLFLVGHSAGAYNAGMVAMNKEYLNKYGLGTQTIKAFAGLAGPYNFTPRAEKYIDIFGEENFEEMKIMNHVDSSIAPSLLLHAKGDNTVALFNQATMKGVLEANGVHVESKLYSQDMGHIRILLNVHPWFARDENVGEDIEQFFAQFK